MNGFGDAIAAGARAALAMLVILVLAIGIPLGIYLAHHLRWTP